MAFAVRRQLQMADNYLENKMAEFREGRTVVRRPSASLESLLKNAGGMISPPDAISAHGCSGRGPSEMGGAVRPARGGDIIPPAELVMPAQIEAVVRAANLLPEAAVFRFDTDENEGIIRLLGPSSPRKHLLDAGQLILAMRLKAAELHLQCAVEYRPESTTPANPLIATIKLYK